MSSVKYADKSPEEIKAILKTFCDIYHKQFEGDADLATLKAKLNELAKKKKDELFYRMFGDLSPRNLGDVCEMIDKDLESDPPKEVPPVVIPPKNPKKPKGS